MEYWFNETGKLDMARNYNQNDFTVENNCSTFDGYEQMKERLTQISDLLKKERAEYLKNLPKMSDKETLEEAIISTLRMQAQSKNFLL